MQKEIKNAAEKEARILAKAKLRKQRKIKNRKVVVAAYAAAYADAAEREARILAKNKNKKRKGCGCRRRRT